MAVGGEIQMECGWGINVCSSRAAFRLEYARETGEVYEVRYMCPRHTAWALELDGRVITVHVTPISWEEGEVIFGDETEVE